ncbi:uncharacterized protein BDZ99DRAFT_507124 [Mytilinidion resinicola]|uniref:Uncharacterized protein n=1 Tax=Mytilinidion resinicola TaxID=574789 RepID=A0A6A6YYF2_9PEZI|nr:uncharacterized protein BDZ99DRAFT_507124 [Mytilinidion resinicola]KAF2812977.1 hypothetical protein BDZ99DRAFT_507124 [Mytilinidion resinicola]
MPRTFPAISILEVERKFRSLARIIHNEYFDRSSLLSLAGIWVRQRNGQWEAKVKKGGNFTNSRFEELLDPRDISKCIKDLTGIGYTEQETFGLERIAILSTTRKAWVADNEFRIVLDTIDFGHTVGEVKLQHQVNFEATSGLSIEQQKQRSMQAMDDRVAKFMERYAWAFCQGVPKGKLTAYFERNAI